MADAEDKVKSDMAALYGGDFEDDDDDDESDFDAEEAEAAAEAEDAALDAAMEAETAVGGGGGGSSSAASTTSAAAAAEAREATTSAAAADVRDTTATTTTAPVVAPIVSVSGYGPLGPRVRLPGFQNMLEPRAPVQDIEYGADAALSTVKGEAEKRARSDAYGAELCDRLDLQRTVDSMTDYVG